MSEVLGLFDKIARADGIDAAPEAPDAALTRAMLANFETGLSHGHIVLDTARQYFASVAVRVEALLQQSRPRTERPDINQIYRSMMVVLEQQRLFFLREPSPAKHIDKQAITVQSHYRLSSWFKIPWTEPYPATLKRLIATARTRATVQSNSMLLPNSEILWLTPYAEEIERLVNSAKQLAQMNRHDDKVATRLREMLGLVNRHPGDHLFALVTRRQVGGFDGNGRLGAPTVFESCGYQRFRHWPPADVSDPAHVGRTYDLNRERRRARPGHHGVPEIVAGALSFGDVEPAIYLGTVGEADDLELGPRGWQMRAEADRDFADEISNGRSIQMLARSLARRLAA